ncbi:zinc finger protein ush isoform X2 [Brevipalpus obovatus]|uniref:zinc finger protein ush isoform X2 n=1 Tax=Brevipalpus obovatus TaxID=246614 RepID=UPI003D9F0B61
MYLIDSFISKRLEQKRMPRRKQDRPKRMKCSPAEILSERAENCHLPESQLELICLTERSSLSKSMAITTTAAADAAVWATTNILTVKNLSSDNPSDSSGSSVTDQAVNSSSSSVSPNVCNFNQQHQHTDECDLTVAAKVIIPKATVFGPFKASYCPINGTDVLTDVDQDIASKDGEQDVDQEKKKKEEEEKDGQEDEEENDDQEDDDDSDDGDIIIDSEQEEKEVNSGDNSCSNNNNNNNSHKTNEENDGGDDDDDDQDESVERMNRDEEEKKRKAKKKRIKRKRRRREKDKTPKETGENDPNTDHLKPCPQSSSSSLGTVLLGEKNSDNFVAKIKIKQKDGEWLKLLRSTANQMDVNAIVLTSKPGNLEITKDVNEGDELKITVGTQFIGCRSQRNGKQCDQQSGVLNMDSDSTMDEGDNNNIPTPSSDRDESVDMIDDDRDDDQDRNQNIHNELASSSQIVQPSSIDTSIDLSTGNISRQSTSNHEALTDKDGQYTPHISSDHQQHHHHHSDNLSSKSSTFLTPPPSDTISKSISPSIGDQQQGPQASCEPSLTPSSSRIHIEFSLPPPPPPPPSPPPTTGFVCSSCTISFSSKDTLIAHQTYYCSNKSLHPKGLRRHIRSTSSSRESISSSSSSVNGNIITINSNRKRKINDHKIDVDDDQQSSSSNRVHQRRLSVAKRNTSANDMSSTNDNESIGDSPTTTATTTTTTTGQTMYSTTENDDGIPMMDSPDANDSDEMIGSDDDVKPKRFRKENTASSVESLSGNETMSLPGNNQYHQHIDKYDVDVKFAANLMMAKNSHHFRHGTVFKCKQCPFSTDKRSSFIKHMQSSSHTSSSSSPSIHVNEDFNCHEQANSNSNHGGDRLPQNMISNQIASDESEDGDTSPDKPVNPSDRYCSQCDIQFSSYKTYRVHKRFYCGSRHGSNKFGHSGSNPLGIFGSNSKKRLLSDDISDMMNNSSKRSSIGVGGGGGNPLDGIMNPIMTAGEAAAAVAATNGLTATTGTTLNGSMVQQPIYIAISTNPLILVPLSLNPETGGLNISQANSVVGPAAAAAVNANSGVIKLTQDDLFASQLNGLLAKGLDKMDLPSLLNSSVAGLDGNRILTSSQENFTEQTSSSNALPEASTSSMSTGSHHQNQHHHSQHHHHHHRHHRRSQSSDSPSNPDRPLDLRASTKIDQDRSSSSNDNDSGDVCKKEIASTPDGPSSTAETISALGSPPPPPPPAATLPLNLFAATRSALRAELTHPLSVPLAAPLAAATPEIVIKQSSYHCKHCQIGFYKKENYLVHRRQYCQRRSHQQRNRDTDNCDSPPDVNDSFDNQISPKSEDGLKSPKLSVSSRTIRSPPHRRSSTTTTVNQRNQSTTAISSSPSPTVVPSSITPMSQSPNSSHSSPPHQPLSQYYCVACGIRFTSLDNLHAHQTYYCLKRNSVSTTPTKASYIVSIPGSGSEVSCIKCKATYCNEEAFLSHVCSEMNFNVITSSLPSNSSKAALAANLHQLSSLTVPGLNSASSPPFSQAQITSALAAAAAVQSACSMGSTAISVSGAQASSSANSNQFFRCTICGYKGHTLRGMRTHVRIHQDKIQGVPEESFIVSIDESSQPPIKARNMINPRRRRRSLEPFGNNSNNSSNNNNNQSGSNENNKPLSLANSIHSEISSENDDTASISENEISKPFGDSVHNCQFCYYSSTYKGNVVRHIKLVHKELVNVLSASNGGGSTHSRKDSLAGVVGDCDESFSAVMNDSSQSDDHPLDLHANSRNATSESPNQSPRHGNSPNPSSNPQPGSSASNDALSNNNNSPQSRKVVPKYCRSCDISFQFLASFIAHKKYYCSSHSNEATVHPPPESKSPV